MNWQIPQRRDAIVRGLKVGAHVVMRGFVDVMDPSWSFHRHGTSLQELPVLAESRTALWMDGRDDEFVLVAGKVHNLRIAAHALNGVEMPAGATFSFWRQIGWPHAMRGFVEGREIRHGCVVPVVGGGICQLSNALMACALEAGLQVVEAHQHSARIEQSSAAGPRADATVFWNYVDLRFRTTAPLRLEVELTADELVVRFRGETTEANERTHRGSAAVPELAPGRHVARGCLTCNETSCYRHRPRAKATASEGISAMLLDGPAPAALAEYAPAARVVEVTRHSRMPAPVAASIARSAISRWGTRSGWPRQRAAMAAADVSARLLEYTLKPTDRHVLIDQPLLVPLWKAGVLAGRRYDVLLRTVPGADLQRRLDEACHRWPDAESLRDFRVDQAMMDAELRALRGANLILTQHHDAARCLAERGYLHIQTFSDPVVARAAGVSSVSIGKPPTVLLPAVAWPRKGSRELISVATELGWRVVVLGVPASESAWMSNFQVEIRQRTKHLDFRDIDVVALPAWVEHDHSALYQALSRGLPVVCSDACGMPPDCGVITVAAGDMRALAEALQRALKDRAVDA